MRACPKCKSSDYNNKAFVLMINVCGHSLCKNCVDSLFARNSGPCPTCGKTLKKNAFWEQIYDDPNVEKEVYWRRRLKKIIDLKEEDLESLKGYNDYLEYVEQLVDRLMADEVDEVLAEVETFRKENAERIDRSRNRKSKDEEWITEQIRMDRAYRERIGFPVLGAHPEAKPEQQRGLIHDLMNSDLPADLLIAKKKKIEAEEEAKKESEASKLENSLFFAPAADADQFAMGPVAALGQPYVYLSPVAPPKSSLPVPTDPEAHEKGYLGNIRAANEAQVGGGFTTGLACRRALTDAFAEIMNLEPSST